jgi:DNA (cytosine-5)-methyltransferase 1
VAGNTFERTPGNRARDAETRPLDVVHGTLDRAVVVPPMGKVAARDAHTAPAPTQPTTTRPALVTRGGVFHPRGGAGGEARDIKDLAEPLHTVRAGGRHHALVMANRANNVPRPAGESTTPPILTGESVAVVMRNNRDTAGEMSTPVDQPIRTLTAGCHQSLVVPYHRTSEAIATDLEPTPTLTTRDRCALLVPYKSRNESIDVSVAPANTMTTRDSAAVVLTEEDIDDCRFRMLQLHEIAAAMAFHPEYLVKGNKREQMAQYGNAVTPPAMELLVTRVLEVLG